MYVQVIAVCKYDWACCAVEAVQAGPTIEGPLGEHEPPSPNKSKKSAN
jgi:hypothetical protein